MSPSIERLCISAEHNFFGHHGRPAGVEPAVVCSEVVCVAGRGLQGDRFFDYKDNYKGQVTFFSVEVFEEVAGAVGAQGQPPEVVRRNIFTRNIDLGALIGRRFRLQGVDFEGTEECRPCHWMDGAVGPGAEARLRGRGGLRARILSDGVLRPGPAALELL